MVELNAEFQDWELLHMEGGSTLFSAIDGAFDFDYFSLNSKSPSSYECPSGIEVEASDLLDPSVSDVFGSESGLGGKSKRKEEEVEVEIVARSFEDSKFSNEGGSEEIGAVFVNFEADAAEKEAVCEESTVALVDASSGLENYNSPNEGTKSMDWWKMPLTVLKFFLLRAKPALSISMAAGILGLVVLVRRLYKMKRKSKSIQLKISLDKKKATPVMARAAQLNHKFSAVRPFPTLHQPLLQANGVAPWPMISSK